MGMMKQILLEGIEILDGAALEKGDDVELMEGRMALGVAVLLREHSKLGEEDRELAEDMFTYWHKISFQQGTDLRT